MKSVTARKSGRWGWNDEGEREKKVEENEKGDKKNRVLEWGSNPVGSDCASGGIPTSYCTNHWAAAIITNCILT